ncbi:MAG: glycogen debranching protein [Lamprobacter sp.]|uniref:amylo-alpha-1,6-glucosidase n=1 Tax=Lamprobacter sp. TaxID=3100796 RepID=UPI002B2592C7|nr:glycogen debranching protein [Lamprobacter sp.]MEA3641646.1 glycogen debranching protein [Lamprobacter sp.]
MPKEPHSRRASEAPPNDAYQRAVQLLQACKSPHGFVASPTKHRNYHRIWARDGAIIALAALLTGDQGLREAAGRTFTTLAQHQGPHGEIPSNVDPVAGRVSYGGTAGRIDANLWFLIGCGEYWRATGDEAFLNRMTPVIEKIRFLLGAWELNNRGLLYIPLTGDWADEYLRNGYVLYDQLLYLQAQRTLAKVHESVHGSADHALTERISRLRHLIRCNYWFAEDDDSPLPDDVYHEVLYRKGLQAAAHCRNRHWMASFSPAGYSYRFDALANVLASLFGVADEAQGQRVDEFIADGIAQEIVQDSDQDINQHSDQNRHGRKAALLPAFHPVIHPVDDDWEDLQMMFSYSFKNAPYEYHNGGLWPMVTGFYVCDLARRGLQQDAQRFLDGINQANALPMDGEPWGFAEYIHGRDLTPGGTRHQGWSAAAAIIGWHALDGQAPFCLELIEESNDKPRTQGGQG